MTVNLRAIDVRSGRVLSNVMTTKTIFSIGRSANVYKFIEFRNCWKPRQATPPTSPRSCVLSAIEAAVAHLIAQGVERRLWQTAEGNGSEHPALSKYLSKLN